MKGNLEKEINEIKTIHKIYKIIEEEKKKYRIKTDYIWLIIKQKNPSLEVTIKIVKNKKPITNEQFLSKVASRINYETGIPKASYDFIHNRGKYQKLHY